MSAVCAGILLCGGSIYPQFALAKDRLTADISAGLQGSTNSNLSNNGSATIGTQANAAVDYRITESRTTLDLGATGSASTYFNGGSSDLAAGLSADLQHRASQTLAVQLFGHYSYSQSNGSGFLLYPAGIVGVPSGTVLTPTTTPTPIITPPVTGLGTVLPPDVTVLGRKLTQKSFGGGAGLQWRLSNRASLSLTASANRQTFNDPLLSSYRALGQSASLSRLISESTTVSAQFQAAEIRYDNGEHDTILTPMIGVNRRLNRIFNLSVSGGAAIVRSRLPDGTRLHSASLAMSANLCGKYEHSRLCFDASRQETPTSLGGVRPLTSVSVTYVDRLNVNDSVTFSAQFDRSSADTRRIFPTQSSAAGTARYDHRLSDRLSLFGSAQYIRIWQSGSPGRTDLRGAVGIALRLGERG